MKKFNNTPNILHTTVENKQIWESRSVAVTCTVIAIFRGELYVLCSKRGQKAADYKGLYNLVAGYLDWNETASEAALREVFEETGLDLEELRNEATEIISWDMNEDSPWKVNSSPKSNKQNVSLRYGAMLKVDYLPALHTNNNEVEGEVEDPMWLPLYKVNDSDWAFSHNDIIVEYRNYVANKILQKYGLNY